MKLLASLTSPYARKLRILALELGLDLPLVETAPLDDGAELLTANPLGKVPALVLDDGSSLVDSRVIADWLLAQVPGQTLRPAAGRAYFTGRAYESIADGILDAAIILRFNMLQGVTSGEWIDRQYRAIDRTLAALTVLVPRDFNYSAICTLVACEYLDLRWPKIDWRRHTALEMLHLAHAERPSLVATRPPG